MKLLNFDKDLKEEDFFNIFKKNNLIYYLNDYNSLLQNNNDIYFTKKINNYYLKFTYYHNKFLKGEVKYKKLNNLNYLFFKNLKVKDYMKETNEANAFSL